jgi:Tol biopolymer transport system component
VIAVAAAALALLVSGGAYPSTGVTPSGERALLATTRAAGEIAFASGGTTIHGDFLGDLYVMSASGKDLRRLTRTRDVSEEDPAWSPDGARITFTRYGYVYPSDAWRGLWVMDARGRNVKRLSTDGDQPAWSPDQRKIAFVRDRSGKCALTVMDSDGTHKRTLTKYEPTATGCFSSPTWSPDSRKIAFERDYQIWVTFADGRSHPQRLTRSAHPSDVSPDWSPDGHLIALDRNGDIYVMNVDGTAARRLTRGHGPEYGPDWSPDGRRIAFVRNEDIWEIDADGSGAHRVIRTRGYDSAPAWSP